MSDTHQQPQRTKRGLDLGTATELADLFHELSHNPKTRKVIAKAIKDAKADSPAAARWDSDFRDVELEDKFETFKREQEEDRIKQQREAVVRQMESKRSGLLTGGPDGSGRKYSEDDVKKIETLMQQKGISDYDDGATLYAAMLPPLDPQPGIDIPAQHGSTWEFPEWAKFGSDPVKASRDTAHTVITEFMRKR